MNAAVSIVLLAAVLGVIVFLLSRRENVPRHILLSYRKLRFHTISNAPRGCALGARVDGCRSNRASARECATAHSFIV